MKIAELRNLLKASERAHLEKAFVECYKQLRKAQKEEIDPVITSVLEGKDIAQKNKEIPVDFSELEREVNEFILNAKAQNYLAPNRVISKSQRPKWRFIVKKFIKQLSDISTDDDNYETAVRSVCADLRGM